MILSHLEEAQRGMQNEALAKVRTPAKVEEPKATPASPNGNTSSTTMTTITKADLNKEKEKVNVQQQRQEEKNDKAGKEQPDIMEIPSDEESGPVLVIEEQTAGMELEAESVAAKVDANSMVGEKIEFVEEQEMEEEEQ